MERESNIADIFTVSQQEEFRRLYISRILASFTFHKKARPVYLKEKSSPCSLQGCAELAKGHQPAGTRAGVKRQAQGLQGMAKRQASGEQAKLPLVAMRVQARLAKMPIQTCLSGTHTS